MTDSARDAAPSRPGILPYLMLVLCNLFWAGNWITGRAVRDAIPPMTLNLGRWLPVAILLAPVALPALRGRWHLVRAHWRQLALYGFLGIILFQDMVYVGLSQTTAINAVLLNSSLPLFVMLLSWFIERDAASPAQIAGMAISLCGILVIMTQGDLHGLLRLEVHAGDAWILLAMPAWGLYSVLLKRRPALPAIPFLFVVVLWGLAGQIPLAIAEMIWVRPPEITATTAASIFYLAVFASIAAFICWNRAVAQLGANIAGFSIHLLPAFGTILAIVFLDETLRPFHVVGLATILAGVFLASRRPGGR